MENFDCIKQTKNIQKEFVNGLVLFKFEKDGVLRVLIQISMKIQKNKGDLRGGKFITECNPRVPS